MPYTASYAGGTEWMKAWGIILEKKYSFQGKSGEFLELWKLLKRISVTDKEPKYWVAFLGEIWGFQDNMLDCQKKLTIVAYELKKCLIQILVKITSSLRVSEGWIDQEAIESQIK